MRAERLTITFHQTAATISSLIESYGSPISHVGVIHVLKQGMVIGGLVNARDAVGKNIRPV